MNYFLMEPLGEVMSNDRKIWKIFKECKWIISAAIAICLLIVPTASVMMKQGRVAFVDLTFPIATWLTGLPMSYLFGIHFKP
eukprot:UN05661